MTSKTTPYFWEGKIIESYELYGEIIDRLEKADKLDLVINTHDSICDKKENHPCWEFYHGHSHACLFSHLKQADLDCDCGIDVHVLASNALIIRLCELLAPN